MDGEGRGRKWGLKLEWRGKGVIVVKCGTELVSMINLVLTMGNVTLWRVW